MLDLRSTLKPDPSALLVEQHLRSYVSLVSRWPEDLEPVLVSAFQGMQERFSDHREPWRIAAGPLGATLCYAKDMGWTAVSLTQWRIEGELWCLDDPVQLEQVVKRIHGHWAMKRRQAIAGLEASAELATGVDWTVGRKLLKKLPGLQAKALQCVWQGALRCGPKAWCSLCDQPASQEHLLWDCKWWQDNHPVPQAVSTALEQLPACVKVRGLPPALASSSGPREVKLTGLWQHKSRLDDPELRYATDGSPGSSGDPRCWKLTWAAIAFVCRNGSPEILATATGPVPGEQTVFRAEAMALLFIAEHTSGGVDVTMDARGVKTRVERRTLGKSSLDLFIPLREHSDRLRLSWIRSHRSLDQHLQEFGAGTEWRWSANAAVDKLAGEEANGARDHSREAQLQAKDKATQKVQSFLAERTALIFGYDKDQGPQVTFEGESAPVSKKTRASGLCRKQRPSQTPAPPNEHPSGSAEAPNKRDLLRAVVNDPPLGHQWVWTSQHQSGARIKCTRCQLGVQQIDKRAKIERLLSQPCVGFGDSAIFSRYWQCHQSHTMCYEGVFWRCMRCKRTQHTGAEATSQHLVLPCKARKEPKPKASPSKSEQSPSQATLFFSGARRSETRPQPQEAPEARPRVRDTVAALRSSSAPAAVSQARPKLPPQHTLDTSKPAEPPSGSGISGPRQLKLSFAKAQAAKPKPQANGPKQTRLCFGAPSSS